MPSRGLGAKPRPWFAPATLQGLKALYPQDRRVDAIEITPVDLAHLDDEEFLNDTIIDFYMKRAPDSALAQPRTCNRRLQSVCR